MPIPDLVYEQLEQLCRFLEPSEDRLWVFRHVKDLQPVVLKILAGIQNDEDNGNIFFHFAAPFLNGEQYCSRILEQFESELSELVAAFEVGGITLPAPVPGPGTVVDRLARRIDAVAECLPKGSGSLVFILDPTAIGHDNQYITALLDLSDRTKSARAKYLVLDSGTAPELDRLRAMGGQDFRLDPATIEAQVAADLAGDELSPDERKQYTAMAGAFAFSKGQVEKAADLQKQVLAMAAQDGDAGGVASALFGLGNTHLKAKKLTDAETYFLHAADVCMKTGNDNLLAMVMLNLGIALHRQGKTEAAIQSFDVGRQTYKALNQLPGEIHALDTKAATFFEAKQADAAKRTWQEALALIEDMSNDAFSELRDSCREDIAGKLKAVSSMAGGFSL